MSAEAKMRSRIWALGFAGCVATGTKTPADTGSESSASGTVEPTATGSTVGPDPTDPSTTATPTPADHTAVPTDESVQQHCVDTINAYRATLGLAPYGRWTGGEACADSQAESDAHSGVPHGAFGSCGEWAQNECPGWSGDLTTLTTDCLAMMWAEGPGADFSRHGHYINMSSTQYSEVACGYYTLPNGSVWAVQDFR